jgi:hypothetical protein
MENMKEKMDMKRTMVDGGGRRRLQWLKQEDNVDLTQEEDKYNEEHLRMW